MAKRFNDTGTCIATKHYMVDTSKKIEKIMALIEDGIYFAINRPRQFGKTTTISLLWKNLITNPAYLVIRLSFEGIGDAMFDSKERFCERFVAYIRQYLETKYPLTLPFLQFNEVENTGFDYLSQIITNFVKSVEKKVVILIDEVDKSSNNQLFLHFLGLLRDKYLLANDGDDFTFHSVILAGVHDVKTLKLKISPESSGKLNSPWNIAADFTIDMSFNSMEISTMLTDYSKDKNIEMDIPAVAEKIYYYTSGYPYLVSKMCKVIDEILIPQQTVTNWNTDAIDAAFRYLTKKSYSTTLFDDLAKNIENNSDLYLFTFDITINGIQKDFKVTNPIVNLAMIYGIIRENNDYCQIHNRIFEQHLYDHFMSKLETSSGYTTIESRSTFITESGLNIKYILTRFQQFMKENYSSKDLKFLEREGRLLFLSFLRPIINGKGHDFKEPNIGEERRMDIVVTYNSLKYVIELKRWEGEKAHQQGLQQLSDYLDLYDLKSGFLLIYNFNKNKEYRHETIQFTDKEIFAVWV